MAEKRKLKIAFLSYYSGLVNRGAETFVHEVANALTNLGHEVIVFQGGGKLKNCVYKTKTIKVKADQGVKSTIRRFTFCSLKDMDRDVDIVYPTNGGWQSVLCRFWTWKNGKRMVISGQSGLGRDDKINLLTFPNCFVALTKNQEKWAKKQNGFVKIKVIPNGVDLRKFDKSIKPINLNLPRPVVLNVSAFVDWKRQELLVRAVAKLGAGSLFLVGSGPEKEKLKKLCEKLMPNRYKITSYPYHKMPAVYPSADVFSFPTVSWESFGIVMLEAMASGLPVVATNDPIRGEIIGKAGILVDPTNTDAYVQALQRALDKKWDDLPRKQAEKYSWEKISLKYEDLFYLIVK